MKTERIINQIINGTLTPLDLNRVDNIVLHHMAHPTADVKEVERWHINNGWTAIGYNYWIAFDGTIYCGRGTNVGAAVKNHNSHIISIGFQGDYNSGIIKAMPYEQYKAAIYLIKELKHILPSLKRICGHSYFKGSVCPGKYFPLKELTTLKEDYEMIYDYIDNNMPDWAHATVRKLIDNGYLHGDEQGRLGLNDTMLKIFVVNDRAGMYERSVKL